MKLAVIFILLHCNFIYSQSETPTKTFKIKADSNSFLIYSLEGELLYKFTPSNTDSLRLETLDMIYSESQDAKDDSIEHSISRVLPVRIENIPEKDSFWSDFIRVLIPTLVAVIFAWFLSFVSQKNQATQTAFFLMMTNQVDILKRIKIEIESLRTNEKMVLEGQEFFSHIQKTFKELYILLSQDFRDEKDDSETSFSEIKRNSYCLDLQTNIISNAELIYFYESRPQAKQNISKVEDELGKSIYIYNFIHDKYADYIRNYFRHLFNIINFIDSSSFIFGKAKLINLIQAQMSDPELFVLFYDGLLFLKMREKINKYKITENLTTEDLMNENHQGFYNFKMKSRKEEKS